MIFPLSRAVLRVKAERLKSNEVECRWRKMQKLTKVGPVKGLFAVLSLLAGTYAPAFLAAALLKLRPAQEVPAVIVITLGLALLFIGFLSNGSGRFGEFGFRLCGHRYLALAIAVGTPAG